MNIRRRQSSGNRGARSRSGLDLSPTSTDTSRMTCVFVRYLCLACGLLLALPPHWCCRVPPAETSVAVPAPKKSCCTQHQSSQPRETPKTPLRPAESERWPCCERSSLMLDDSAKFAPDGVPSVPY